MSHKKINWFYWILLIFFIWLLGKLMILQLAEFKYYQSLADENRISLTILPATRGIFYDRFNQVLVNNAPGGREYVNGESSSQVLGYVGEVSEEELAICREQNICQRRLKDLVGKTGLEQEYDEKLRGIDGGLLIETDAEGNKLREIGRQEPVAGENITLTLDIGLQKEAYKLLQGRKGAVVVSEPKTGEILALVSSPGFKPDKLAEYLTNKDLPLFNRAIGGEYPPGSVFKIITAIAALEEGKIDAKTLIEDTGEIKVGSYSYSNWYFTQYGRKEGQLNLIRALARSNDIFFYKLGEELGMIKLADWAKYFNGGVRTQIDLPGEANGLIPDPEWKKKFIGESWYLGDTYIAAIGQGNILMTPLQVNQMTEVVANDGWWCQPHLAKFIEANCKKLEIQEKNLNLVKEGMKQVMETGGTAWPFFDFKVKGQKMAVAGKTGTAEFGSDVKSEQAQTHAWFTGFAPADQPQIVVTVLLEAAGEGSYQAAPVAKDLLKYWLERK